MSSRSSSITRSAANSTTGSTTPNSRQLKFPHRRNSADRNSPKSPYEEQQQELTPGYLAGGVYLLRGNSENQATSFGQHINPHHALGERPFEIENQDHSPKSPTRRSPRKSAASPPKPSTSRHHGNFVSTSPKSVTNLSKKGLSSELEGRSTRRGRSKRSLSGSRKSPTINLSQSHFASFQDEPIPVGDENLELHPVSSIFTKFINIMYITLNYLLGICLNTFNFFGQWFNKPIAIVLTTILGYFVMVCVLDPSSVAFFIKTNSNNQSSNVSWTVPKWNQVFPQVSLPLKDTLFGQNYETKQSKIFNTLIEQAQLAHRLYTDETESLLEAYTKFDSFRSSSAASFDFNESLAQFNSYLTSLKENGKSIEGIIQRIKDPKSRFRMNDINNLLSQLQGYSTQYQKIFDTPKNTVFNLNPRTLSEYIISLIIQEYPNSRSQAWIKHIFINVFDSNSEPILNNHLILHLFDPSMEDKIGRLTEIFYKSAIINSAKDQRFVPENIHSRKLNEQLPIVRAKIVSLIRADSRGSTLDLDSEMKNSVQGFFDGFNRMSIDELYNEEVKVLTSSCTSDPSSGPTDCEALIQALKINLYGPEDYARADKAARVLGDGTHTLYQITPAPGILSNFRLGAIERFLNNIGLKYPQNTAHFILSDNFPDDYCWKIEGNSKLTLEMGYLIKPTTFKLKFTVPSTSQPAKPEAIPSEFIKFFGMTLSPTDRNNLRKIDTSNRPDVFHQLPITITSDDSNVISFDTTFNSNDQLQYYKYYQIQIPSHEALDLCISRINIHGYPKL